MCRWIAYSGKPILLETLITKPTRSLLEQSLNSRLSFKPDGTALPTNGDGFGMGWYGEGQEPGLYKVPAPAWNDVNIHELCAHLRSGLFMAHIRAANVGAIQRTNTHPFKYKNWLFQHNGYISHFDVLRRDLQFALTPEFYNYLSGTTDSETFFLLALSFGLEREPKAAVERAIRCVMTTCTGKGVAPEVLLSCALTDGKRLYTLRYSSGERTHSQYYSTHASCLKDLCEANEMMPKHSVVVVSEPLDQSGDMWQEMPVNSFSIIEGGKVAVEPLEVR